MRSMRKPNIATESQKYGCFFMDCTVALVNTYEGRKLSQLVQKSVIHMIKERTNAPKPDTKTPKTSS